MYRSPNKVLLQSKSRAKLMDRLESASEHVLSRDRNELPKNQKVCKSDCAVVKTESIVVSHKSSSSQIRRKQLELAAAEEKARIAMELIDKRLECDLAMVEDSSMRSKSTPASIGGRQSNVEQWLEHSNVQPSPVAAPTATEAAPAPIAELRRAPAPAMPVDGILQLAHTLKDIMTTTSPPKQDERLLTRLSTPRELPIFSGDCFDWLHFRSAYDESTHVCQFSDSENLWRLRRALRGEAKEAVTDLLIGGTSPAIVMEALELRFGHPDLIVQQLTSQMRKLSPLSTNYQNDIIQFSMKVNNCVATLNSLNQHDYLRSPEMLTSIITKLPSVLISKWTDYAYDKLASNVPKLQLLAAFLKREATVASTVGVTHLRENRKPDPVQHGRTKPEDKPRQYTYNRPVFTTAMKANQSKLSTLCSFCSKSVHLLTECRLFKHAMRKHRWKFIKAQNLCFCCLLERHNNDSCPAPVCDIDGCGLPHNRLLHFKKPAANTAPTMRDVGSPETPPDVNESSSERGETVACVSAGREPPPPPPLPSGARGSPAAAALGAAAGPPAPRSVSEVLLKVIKVNLSGPKGIVSAYALLDDGASISLIDRDLVSELGLTTSHSNPIKFIDAFGIEIYQSHVPKVTTNICGKFENKSFDINLRVINNLKLPQQDLSIVKNLQSSHLLKIKNSVCSECVVPRLLIGEDNYFLIAPREILHGNKQEPYATRCLLGWSIHGCLGCAHTPMNGHTFHLAHSEDADNTITELNNLVKKSFELDSIGISTVRRENTAHLRAVRILDETARNIGNQWEVGLPFTKEQLFFPDTYNYARNRLQGLIKRFQSDGTYAEKYRREMQRLFDNGYARVLEDNEPAPSHTWYLSHFGVQNTNKPDKLRLVFDCAGKVNGVCLNDFLLTGPDLYNSLLGIMLRFREHKIALTADIKDFFVQIKIRAEDQNVFRFLWQESTDDCLKICVMQSLLFGATCSPFIAQYIKNKNAIKYSEERPEAVYVILNNHYMDDCLHSCDSETQAIQLIREITEIHKSGGFEITRWSSNNKQVLQSIPTGSLAPAAIALQHGATNTAERTLGLMWHPSEDSFGFKIDLDRILPNILSGTEIPTKAQMLSIIMSVYDIHGFLSPFLIKAKIIFQNVHRSGIEWSSKLKSEEHTLWVSWLNDLQCLRSLRIPRFYGNAHAWIDCYSSQQILTYFINTNINKYDNDIVSRQMHIFCDASLKAYASVIYWRFIRADGCVLISFVASKSRVSPLKPVSIPRLELQGALLGARLADAIQREHKDIQPAKRYFWTDSSTVLQWIRSDPRCYKPYVAHRLGEIDDLTKSCEWRHVPSASNVADMATREDAPPLTYSSDWFQGPSFLRLPEDQWPKDRKFSKSLEDAKCEERTVHLVVENKSVMSLPNENNISNWLILVRATARVLLFIRRCQRKKCQLDTLLMKEAEDLLLKKCQNDSFAVDIILLKQNKSLSRDSRLLQLCPYLDETGILRVGGRIGVGVAGVDRDMRRPAILEGKHRITRLLVECFHRQAFHGANELVVNNLRQRYWILKLRPTIRAVASHCLLCRYRRATPQPQRMGDLPAARLQHNRRPFSYTGVDFFGPLEVTVGRGKQKRYCMLFTCLTVRAIHIESTENLTTDSTIMALRRMAARRGMPQVIISDNGTNLRGADTELRRSVAELDQEAIREAGTIRGVEWKFIPPGAPEMGGAWERMIRTVKSSLKIILKQRAPHTETLLTVLAEVESLVNSRPITYVSNDPQYPEALTPNHFLIGSSSSIPQFGKYDNSDLCLRKRWRVAQRLTDMFWSRWIKEYLPTLLPRQKWTSESRQLKVNDYVIIVEPNLERNCWRHGIVSATHAGRDGRVRVVDVRTRTGVLRRPVTRVALLAPQDDSAN